MSNSPINVSAAEWQREVLDSTTPVLVDFWAAWCGPCKMVAPIVAELAEEFDGRMRVVKLDADANPELLTQYGVMGLPTLMLFRNGEVIERMPGFNPKPKILNKLAAHL